MLVPNSAVLICVGPGMLRHSADFCHITQCKAERSNSERKERMQPKPPQYQQESYAEQAAVNAQQSQIWCIAISDSVFLVFQGLDPCRGISGTGREIKWCRQPFFVSTKGYGQLDIFQH